MSTDPSSGVPPSFAAALADNPLLHGMADSDRVLLAPYLRRETHDADSVVLKEGATDRDLYFLLEGEGRVMHGDLELGTLSKGEQFGALGLVTGSPHSASIVAKTVLAVARLTSERYEAMAVDQPALALRFTRALVAGLGVRLGDVTESVGVLLRERSIPRTTRVKVRLNGGTSEVRTGTAVGDVLPEVVNGRAVVAALMDRRAVSLIAPIASACRLEPLTTERWEGRRIYTHSLSLLLLEAARGNNPGLDIRMAHSLGVAQRVTVGDDVSVDLESLAAELEERMRAIAATNAPLREEWWTVDEAREHFTAAGLHRVAELLRTWRDPAVPLATYGSVYALDIVPLLPSTGTMTGFRVLADGTGLLLVYGSEAARSGDRPGGRTPDSAGVAEARAASSHAQSMTDAHHRWLRELEVTSVGELNRACITGDVPQLVRVSEGFQEKRISTIANQIRDLGDQVKVVCAAGPSTTGKTTIIKRLEVQLQVNGLHPVGISLDAYYVDRKETPLDADGEYDFEAFGALRTDLMQDQLGRLLSGERVRTARYDFKAGRSFPEGGSDIALEEHDILMLEGIHGLNPRLLDSVPAERIFRIFICPVAQLPFDHLTRVHASDVRLLRRLVRDRRSRGHNAMASILRWPSVRRGERRHIFPYQHHADAIFDSSLIYELSVLKVFAERYLLEVPHDHQAYTTAFRLLQLLDRFVTIYPDDVPPTSILREFIGGSGFGA
jgi:uridine kinase